MGTSDTAPRWVTTYACDARPGDLLRIAGEHCRVDNRTYPDVTEAAFTIIQPDGSQIPLRKLDKVEIFDPDGTVAERIAAISAGQP